MSCEYCLTETNQHAAWCSVIRGVIDVLRKQDRLFGALKSQLRDANDELEEIKGVFPTQDNTLSARNTLCWRCPSAYPETLTRCPKCGSTNAIMERREAMDKINRDSENEIRNSFAEIAALNAREKV